MWSLFQQGELTAERPLTGVFARDETAADTDAVLVTIEDARQEAILRALGRDNT